MDTPKITKETKNKIHVEFEGKIPYWQRLKAKVFSTYFLQNVVWYAFRLVLMIGISYVILFPFFSKITASFMGPTDFVDATVLMIPKAFTLDTYRYIFLENNYLQAFINTLLLSLSSALIQTFICCLIGYGLAKFKFKGNKLIMFLVIFTMIVPHSTVRLSMLMHFRYFDLGVIQGIQHSGVTSYKGIIELITGQALDLTNTFAPMIILSVCGLAFKNGLYIYMMRQFFKGVPDELEESAYVDGSGTLRTFFQIIIPLSVPMMITIFLFSFSWQWTDDFYTNLFFQTSQTTLMPTVATTIPLSLQTDYAGQVAYYTAIKNTAGIMIIAPLVVVYLFCQRYLIQGIERSGIVG